MFRCVLQEEKKMSEIYFGRGNASMYDEYMDFINYVFGFNGNERDFKTLLPKLYGPDDDPASSSYVVTEDGHLKAVIGAFDHDLMIGGEYIKTRGIGNVAVHPYARSRGYMKKLMYAALDDMIKDGVVLSVLGGRRQRYNYFSYERIGVKYSFSFNDDNIRHALGRERNHAITLKSVEKADTELLQAIYALYKAEPLYGIRNEARLYDIMTSWKQSVYAGFDGDELLGYCIYGDGAVSELVMKDYSRAAEFVFALYDKVGRSIGVKMPPYHTKAIEVLSEKCEAFSIETPKQFSVLNYEKLTGALLKVKSMYSKLPDGELTLCINGYAGRENITITSHNNELSVKATDKTPDYTLDHLDAMRFMFSPMCAMREGASDFARLLLPLPLYLFASDAV